MMRTIAEMGARLFEKFAELRKAEKLRTKPAPISIIGAPASEASITPRDFFNKGDQTMKSQSFQIGQIYQNILRDGEKVRVPLKDAARFCDLCEGTGKVKDASIRCPLCQGSGLLNREGQGVNEVVRATSNNTEGSRGGAFGTDHATLSDADRRVHDYLEHQAKFASHRAGFRIDSSPEGKARRQKTFDAMAAYDDERESAWKDVSSTFEQNVTTLSKPPTPEELEQIKRNDGRTTAQIAKDHQARMAEETRNYENFLANAYKQLR
jgi:hypothetical protein